MGIDLTIRIEGAGDEYDMEFDSGLNFPRKTIENSGGGEKIGGGCHYSQVTGNRAQPTVADGYCSLHAMFGQGTPVRCNLQATRLRIQHALRQHKDRLLRSPFFAPHFTPPLD